MEEGVLCPRYSCCLERCAGSKGSLVSLLLTDDRSKFRGVTSDENKGWGGDSCALLSAALGRSRRAGRAGKSEKTRWVLLVWAFCFISLQ